MNTKYMNEKEILCDIAESEKQLGSWSFIFACKCRDGNLKKEFLNIAYENASNSDELFDYMRNNKHIVEENAAQELKNNLFQRFSAESGSVK